ncbi:MAG: tRNA (adenosine(37)-N6)-threonylcarbamoyltransferase complex dimerization subunit type 1 TsaB [Polaromonas sp. 39-63-203]|jgi:tRNA threonylcarbamoyladenosine biosynthesis protein TsaB|uniref:tRNA (adenosine(37)-N6)-threonylcarbamoyltransferase complex dimerization subunit type 1 TsaB n=1 Tax=Polaromonas sp. TaxID=1869339 RepID=UPI000BCFCDAE|nr:tRNA (adenosine(37)-N6)-threonylcarbamoyltransferase complex dimerization subunit type 1 TsaB [Polaromonas sp.]OYY48559.1 MAG: tRNA (adenosine(37)-N6)-threonylcarbamoyltransferase complex dimerization subunit type 1 TsaB [Polaromonas sp. 35-63-240]OYZ76190.1 MAG: tRNA (adenosine(37)-N6)-threonylcarbamoyltransferase complex dimerization subunit type 1 TsaB [Polaromonas sp. 24-62-144]OZA95282.1 MAG: tRNA (adenosine(37)-N6)-threonylcarbamoyltransferase complex dimerization subunit type 1 TsaB [P
MPENLKTATKFLAFDTSTDRMSIALTDGVRVWQHSGAGGAQASSTLIPSILALLAEAGLELGALDAIAFGRGPGSFTGLRTACAVAQGLAFGAGHGAGMPVLPIDTLMAVAEEARYRQALQHGLIEGAAMPLRVTALLDARMDEMYVQSYEFNSGLWTQTAGCALLRPENLMPDAGTQLLAGNVFGVYAQRLPAPRAGLTCVEALPTATALLRLAPALAAAGHCVDAALALPLYVRDKVAFTTAERAATKALAVQALATPATPAPPDRVH